MPAKKKTRTTREKETTSQALAVNTTYQETSAYNPTKKYILIGVGVAIVLTLLYVFKGLFVAALVNGQPISRLSIVKNLEKQGGKQTLNSHITALLILQEANKKNISVSDSDLEAEIKKIQDKVAASGQNIDQLLTQKGMTRNDLKERIRSQKIVEKLLGKPITVTDTEVNDYMEKNKSTMPEGSANNPQFKQSIRQQLLQEKQQKEYQTLVDNLQKNASIQYFVSY